MKSNQSDALVFFGATGDLAYKKIFPSLQAMAGDATVFARQDYLEEAWRIVDHYLSSDTPVYEYDPQTWGPPELASQMKPEGGWHYPETKATV